VTALAVALVTAPATAAAAPVVQIDAVSDSLLGFADTSTDVTWHADQDGTYSVRIGDSGARAAWGDKTYVEQTPRQHTKRTDGSGFDSQQQSRSRTEEQPIALATLPGRTQHDGWLAADDCLAVDRQRRIEGAERHGQGEGRLLPQAFQFAALGVVRAAIVGAPSARSIEAFPVWFAADEDSAVKLVRRLVRHFCRIHGRLRRHQSTFHHPRRQLRPGVTAARLEIALDNRVGSDAS